MLSMEHPPQLSTTRYLFVLLSLLSRFLSFFGRRKKRQSSSGWKICLLQPETEIGSCPVPPSAASFSDSKSDSSKMSQKA